MSPKVHVIWQHDEKKRKRKCMWLTGSDAYVHSSDTTLVAVPPNHYRTATRSLSYLLASSMLRNSWVFAGFQKNIPVAPMNTPHEWARTLRLWLHWAVIIVIGAIVGEVRWPTVHPPQDPIKLVSKVAPGSPEIKTKMFPRISWDGAELWPLIQHISQFWDF